MNRTIIITILILLVPILCISQKMDLIFGLKWDMTESTVISEVKKTRDVYPSKQTGTDLISSIHYNGLYFDNHKSVATVLYFSNRRLLFIEIYLEASKESSKIFDSIKHTLREKYFEPQQCEKKPVFCSWFFPEDDVDAKSGFLQLGLENDDKVGDRIVIVYRKEKPKATSDF